MNEGRRQHPRYRAEEVVVIAQFATSHELFRVPCRDIGVGGVFLETRHRATVGETVALTLKLPSGDGAHTIEIVGEVVRADDDGSGLALAFLWPEGDGVARSALEACLGELDPGSAAGEPPPA